MKYGTTKQSMQISGHTSECLKAEMMIHFVYVIC